MVEGYIDVIAMVRAGFEAAVAPLGTALTEDQLALLWKMSDEPVLCFDGDSAGRSAAYRAVDLALPHLQPGKSLKFALLPDGQDPDDLVRSGGREAVGGSARRRRARWRRCCGCARPKPAPSIRRSAEPRWKRASRRSPPGSATRPCANITGRIFPSGCARCSARTRFRARAARRAAAPRRLAAGPVAAAAGRGGGSYSGRGRTSRPRPALSRAPAPQLATSAIHRGYRTAIPPREALILQAVINHPWLLHDHLEDLAELEFRHAEAGRLKGVLIDIYAHDGGIDGPRLQAEAVARGVGDLLERVDRAITTIRSGPGAGNRPGGRFIDVETACCLASAVAFPN